MTGFHPDAAIGDRFDGKEPPVIERLRGRLVVSCQAPVGSPLREPHITALIARAAILGGAAGIRVNGPEDVRAVRAVTDLPIIGLHKVARERRSIITPTLDLARGLVDAGADIVAVDATAELFGDELAGFGRIVAGLDVPVMADASTLAEGVRAAELGAAMVGTTLAGYTAYTVGGTDGPDLALVAGLAATGLPVVAEGRYRTPHEVAAAFDVGAFCVVVGGAITDPLQTTRRFAAAATAPAGARPVDS